jgi:pilus assembly protein TadC
VTNPWLIGGISAVLAGLAVLGWMRAPSGRRLPTPSAVDSPLPLELPLWARATRGPGWRGIVRGRLDVPPFGHRLLVAGAGSAAVALVLVALIASLSVALVAALVPVAAVAGAIGLGALEPATSRKRQRRLIMETPQALDLLAACLAAGLPPRNATAAVVSVFDGPLAEDLGAVARAVEVGLADATAWRSLRGHPQLGEAAVDLARAVESGTRMVETLTFYAREARQRRAAAVESSAKAVGVRCVLPMMICFVPSFIVMGVLPAVVSAFLAAVPHIF